MNKPTVGFKIEIMVEPDDGAYHAYCPALKGLHVGGDTEEEAVKNARDAAIAYLESLVKHGEPIPVGILVEGIPSPAVMAKKRISRHTEDLQIACAI